MTGKLKGVLQRQQRLAPGIRLHAMAGPIVPVPALQQPTANGIRRLDAPLQFAVGVAQTSPCSAVTREAFIGVRLSSSLRVLMMTRALQRRPLSGKAACADATARPTVTLSANDALVGEARRRIEDGLYDRHSRACRR